MSLLESARESDAKSAQAVPTRSASFADFLERRHPPRTLHRLGEGIEAIDRLARSIEHVARVGEWQVVKTHARRATGPSHAGGGGNRGRAQRGETRTFVAQQVAQGGAGDRYRRELAHRCGAERVCGCT